ncbi:hypothetical protein WI36_27040 [Burkholderia ubonensis]|nr:hypothetical protein WI36_27040 [Burkholderia ubonensis]
MISATLRILRDNVPYISGLTSFWVIFQEIKTLALQFLGTPRYSLRIRMRSTLLATNNHSKIRQLSFGDIAQYLFKRLSCIIFFVER